MIISCNKLKHHIKDSEKIDWLKIWDTFTIRTAEVEGVTVKGEDMKDVVVSEIVSCEAHPKKEQYHILKVSDGTKEYSILCGAPNVRVGMKAPLVKVGGMVSGFPITEKKIAGVLSEGMLCAMDELGIGADHTGIMELPSDYPLGADLKSLLPIEDILVEIDNKSLTNRPDLWGHYGIAREIAAISGHELLPLPLLEVENNKKDLDIKVLATDVCSRYIGVTVEDLHNNKTPYELQIFLYFCGMRSISLFVDLTNYVMLELGQPMHAFDYRIVKNIRVAKANEKDTYTTLDGVERHLSNEMLMIKNDKKYFAVAGVMGGLDSEILEDTDAIFLESATFDAASVRKCATALGLRTEASARYEKSLDPNMAMQGVKRFLYLLHQENPNMVVSSNITDVYPKPLESPVISLTKEKLRTYMSFTMEDKEVKRILESLSFGVLVEKDRYVVTVPTYRATKDVTMDADLIEEIARMYGYENFEIKPLALDLTFKEYEHTYNEEYEVKRYLATRYDLNEVHSYLWYDNAFNHKVGVNKEGITLLGKSENHLLRDDLSYSLLPMVRDNLKNLSEVGIFEIGTVIQNGENSRRLGIVLAGNEMDAEKYYYKLKEMVVSLVATLKHKEIVFKKESLKSYYDEGYTYSILVEQENLGTMGIFKSNICSAVGKKKIVLFAEIDFDAFVHMHKSETIYEPLSKYPSVTLDYTVILGLENKYEDLDKVLATFESPIIKNRELVATYIGKYEKRYTIRYILSSMEKTLESEELADFKEKFIEHIKENGYGIVE